MPRASIRSVRAASRFGTFVGYVGHVDLGGVRERRPRPRGVRSRTDQGSDRVSGDAPAGWIAPRPPGFPLDRGRSAVRLVPCDQPETERGGPGRAVRAALVIAL